MMMKSRKPRKVKARIENKEIVLLQDKFDEVHAEMLRLIFENPDKEELKMYLFQTIQGFNKFSNALGLNPNHNPNISK